MPRVLRREPVGLPEHGERWGLTLAVLLGVYLIGSLTTSDIGRASVVVMLSVLVIQIVQVEHVDHRLRILNFSALFVALFLSALHIASDHHIIASLQATAVAIVSISAGAAILSRIARHQLITVRTVLGALDVYVLMGLSFAAVYAALYDWTGDFFNQAGHGGLREFFYYSAITLTTVGFGDLTPMTPLARSLTAIEALLGQIFLVTAVARFVSIMGQNRPASLHPPRTGDQGGSEDNGGSDIDDAAADGPGGTEPQATGG